MTVKQLLLLVLAAVITVTASSVLADDTDIYTSGGVELPEGSEPLVMFSLDYRPNLTSTVCNNGECQFLVDENFLEQADSYTFIEMLTAVIEKVITPLSGVKVGLMLNHNNNTGDPLIPPCSGSDIPNCTNGGYIAMGFELFAVNETSNDVTGAKAKFLNILKSLPPPNDGGHIYQGREMFFEFYRYLTGKPVYNGHNGWNDYPPGDLLVNLDEEDPPISWDETIEDGAGNYISPLANAGICSKIFTVNPMFQVSSQETQSDDEIRKPISEGGLGLPRNNPKAFEDVIGYLNDADLGSGLYGVPDIEGLQNVTSYFIVDPRFAADNQKGAAYARAGGTGQPLELTEDPRELINALQEVFRQILSVSTTFVAASVPVNAFNRAEVIDNVYIALFQVDKDGQPVWTGNLKKLKLEGANDPTANVRLVDQNGISAIAADGRIRSDALTFWTTDFSAEEALRAEVAGRDGRIVDLGGAGQQIPIPDSRQIYFDPDANSGNLIPLVATEAAGLWDDMGLDGTDIAAAVTEAEGLIAYARGDGRSWLFGDSLHARPLPINYGVLDGSYTQENPAIFIAVGSNDGVLRFIRNTTTGGGESGQEVWAFMPRSIMHTLPDMRDNIPDSPQIYSVDGAPVAYINDVNQDGTINGTDGDTAWLFFGLRRGGKAYYALDVTDPLDPQMLWRIEKDATDFAELGYTFSTPRIGFLDWGSGERPALIFGGGYDMNKDYPDDVSLRGQPGTNDSEGMALFVVDAQTGELVWKARNSDFNNGSSAPVFEHPDLVDSVPSTVSVADTDGNRLTDRALFGDTGGNVWRADFAGTDRSNWSLSLLAQLGRHADTGKVNDRRFLHRPDLVQTQDANGPFDAVLIGSGDRTDPLDNDIQTSADTTVNYFYMIKDRNTGVRNAGDATITPVVHAGLTDLTTTNCAGDTPCTGLDSGWKLEMTATGEKILASPVTIAGQVFFTSYIPNRDSANPCQPAEGLGNIYAVGLQDARPVRNYFEVVVEGQDPSELTIEDRSEQLASPGIPAEVVALPPNRILRPDLQIERLDFTTRWRTYWYIEEGDAL